MCNHAFPTFLILLLAFLPFLAPAPAQAALNRWSTGGPYGGTATSVVFDPLSPTTAYVGSFSAGVFKTKNRGMKWTAMDGGLSNLNVFSLAIDPSNPMTLYAGTDGGGVFKTTNGRTKTSDFATQARLS